MGPPLCSGGYQPSPIRAQSTWPCFNGATTLQWWIPEHQIARVHARLVASMGPPLCSGGYVLYPVIRTKQHNASFNGATTLQWWIRPSVLAFPTPLCSTLQWGHHFAVVDTSVSTSAIARAVRRFNGATTLQWWIPSPHFSMPGERMTLQWGHHFAVVDTAHGASVCAPPDQASMGPPLCSGGYPPQSGSSTEISTRFNGATTLQWWIH